MIIANNSYYMGVFTLPLRKDSHYGSTLDYLGLTANATRRTSVTVFPTISGSNFKQETVLAVHASTATKATSLSIPIRATYGIRGWDIPKSR